ncbi:tyrosine-type recombinase/integrase, partial [Klebsiella pneumoniae]|uniref:tyrosine-type recombinase/integrase n=4 Tax=Klebsiella pneumoniae TaxID=573 RepID=UPI003525E13C
SVGEISVKTGNNARNGGKNSLNRLIRCVCGKKIGPDPRNFNQRVSLGRNDLLIRTFPKSLWRIPAKREEIKGVRYSYRGMKMKEEHIVPLSRQAIVLLEQLKQISGDKELLFPGDHDATKVMSENTVNGALRAMGYDTKTEVCGHGFRTMARGALGESGLWSDDAIERQLSHSERNNVRAAYIHTSEHLDERRLMVQWWADYLKSNEGKIVTPYEFAKIRKS